MEAQWTLDGWGTGKAKTTGCLVHSLEAKAEAADLPDHQMEAGLEVLGRSEDV